MTDRCESSRVLIFRELRKLRYDTNVLEMQIDVYGKNVTNGKWMVEIPVKNVCPACSCVLYILTISASKTHAQKVRNGFKHRYMENIVKDIGILLVAQGRI
jgi:hypothetical protein